jgi:hypothetical protein
MNYAAMTTEALRRIESKTRAAIQNDIDANLSPTGTIMRTRYGILGAVSAELAKR